MGFAPSPDPRSSSASFMAPPPVLDLPVAPCIFLIFALSEPLATNRKIKVHHAVGIFLPLHTHAFIKIKIAAKFITKGKSIQ